jgi:urease accessory protein
VIATARAVIEVGGVLREAASQPPVTLRQVRGEDPGTCTVCVVGSAAGPLAGDRIELEVDVRPAARAALIATGASLAQGRSNFMESSNVVGPSNVGGRLSTRLTVAEGARLSGEPAPLIVCAGSAVEVELDIRLAGTAALMWREILVLGRLGESPGTASLDWRVSRAGRPVLRQRIDLTNPALLRWPGMLAGAAVLASALVTGPDVRARTLIDSPTAVCQPIDDRTALITVLDPDAACAQHRLDRLLAKLGAG